MNQQLIEAMRPQIRQVRDPRLDLSFVQHFIQISTCLVNLNNYPLAFLYLIQGINLGLDDIRLNLQFAQLILDAQSNNFLDKRSQPLFKKVMELWAKNIPPALLLNDDIKLWIGELKQHKDAIDQKSLSKEFQDFEALHGKRFCKKCMPDLDQILQEALFLIFDDYKCSCHQIEEDVLKLNNVRAGANALHDHLESSVSSSERKQKKQRKKKNGKQRDNSEVGEEVKSLVQSDDSGCFECKAFSQLEEENCKLKSIIRTLKQEKSKL